jgi:hypothetical protein
MAFDPKQLACLNSMNGFSHFVYKSAGDAHAAIDTSGYFSGDCVNFMRVGDIVEVLVFTDNTFATLSTYGRHVVISNNGTAVNVSDVTAGTVTNTD